MSVVKHFWELRVYREAFDSVMQIFEHSKQWLISRRQVREDGFEYEVSKNHFLKGTLSAVLLLWGTSAVALGPHEVAVLVNEADPASVELADFYMFERGVPAENRVALALPEAANVISPEEFETLIWNPAVEVLKNNGVSEHIFVWAYSCGFPTRVSTSPPVALTGFTFVKMKLPEAEVVRDGLWKSPLYIGPDVPGGNILFAKSLHSYRRWLLDEMPLPSMMLGVVGKYGNTREEALNVLRNAAEADAAFPEGAVYLVESDDIRSRCRQWQFELLKRPLSKAGVDLKIVNKMPKAGAEIIGIMSGTAKVNFDSTWRFMPGAYAEHLTSHAGDFSHGGQTKLTEWLRAGASASSGTVVEPMSNWRKFPAASFFAAYVDGCTLVESIYQATRSPLQLLVVGDPLAAPWKQPAQVALDGFSAKPGVNAFKVTIQVSGDGATRFSDGYFLLNGRRFADGMSCTVEPAKLAPGRYRLRGVAVMQGLISQQVYAEESFVVPEESKELTRGK